MSRGSEETNFPKKIYRYQQAHEKMLSITHQRNANPSHKKIPSQSCQNILFSRTQDNREKVTIVHSWWEGNWYSHCGKNRKKKYGYFQKEIKNRSTIYFRNSNSGYLSEKNQLSENIYAPLQSRQHHLQ